jgi:hypothetical protein
VAKFYEKIH